jgi:hypothetical protein
MKRKCQDEINSFIVIHTFTTLVTRSRQRTVENEWRIQTHHHTLNRCFIIIDHDHNSKFLVLDLKAFCLLLLLLFISHPCVLFGKH